VSVQKIALSSLQSEHDKLLAAFSRSQTRASALEKKHAVSDSEIISLSEEKMRLQAQVIELEHDVEELTRTRDEFRQAAVQEGAQYVEIVKKASQLEEFAAEERKTWSKLRAEMERTIETLRAGSSASDVPVRTPAFLPITHVIDDINTPVSSVEAQSDLKIEPTAEDLPTSYPKEFLTDSNGALKEEIRRLRSRCAEVETALRAVRDDSRNMEGIVQALGIAGKSILERADRALGSVADD
jgi:chromosome segregation ATPase